jgi:hypothetical protein
LIDQNGRAEENEMAKRTLQLLLVACLTTGASWAASQAASDPFVGKWKLNPAKSRVTDQMKVESLGDNKYTFDFGGGAENVVVNGTDQPGNFGTTLSVAVEGPKTWKVIRKQDGRTFISAIWNLSEDGDTLTDNFTGIQPDGSSHTEKYVYKRAAAGSGFAATWVSASEMVSSFVLEVQPYEGDGLSFSVPGEEQTTSVKFDGKDYPHAGRNAMAGSVSSARRLNPRTLELTDKANGKIFDKRQFELSSDLKTLSMTKQVSGQSNPNIWVFERQ